jgi:hypothetical protein
MILLSTIQQINSKFQDKTVNILDVKESQIATELLLNPLSGSTLPLTSEIIWH